MAVAQLRDSRGFWATLLALLQVAVAVAIAVVVRRQLWSWTGGWRWSASWWSKTSSDNVCLMTSGSVNLCAFMYVVVAVSLAASAALLLFQCISRRPARRGCCRGCCGRCCSSLETWMALLLSTWWAAAAITATVYGVRADNMQPSVPEQGSRTAVWAMAWAETGLWGLSVLFALCGRRVARSVSETELTASLEGGRSHYQRYQDTPFNNRSSKWRDARDAYTARTGSTGPSSFAVKQLAP